MKAISQMGDWMTRHPRLNVAMVCGGLFASGLLVGVVGSSVAVKWSAESRIRRAGDPAQVARIMGSDLDLTPEQQAKLQPIITSNVTKMNEVWQETFHKSDEILAASFKEASAILTSEQREKFAESEERRRAHWMRLSPGMPPGPGHGGGFPMADRGLPLPPGMPGPAMPNGMTIPGLPPNGVGAPMGMPGIPALPKGMPGIPPEFAVKQGGLPPSMPPLPPPPGVAGPWPTVAPQIQAQAGPGPAFNALPPGASHPAKTNGFTAPGVPPPPIDEHQTFPPPAAEKEKPKTP